jgi:preprotein translocase subunit SecF
MWIVKNRKIFFAISAVLVTLAAISIFVRGMNIGIDFTGGVSFDVTYPQDMPDLTEVKETLASAGIRNVTVRPFGEDGYMFETQETTEELQQNVFAALQSEVADASSTPVMGIPSFIGPSIGAELRDKAWIAITTVVLGIILFIAYAFRHASDKVSSWKYGVIAVIALVHDVMIPAGVVALLGLPVDSLFVIALLAILGLSVNDTIIVFDRVRENLKLKISRNFEETVGKSLEQTFVRSISTSFTTLLVIAMLYFLGPETTKEFALVLGVGMIVGTYSSIFLASPLLIEAEKLQQEQKKKEKEESK